MRLPVRALALAVLGAGSVLLAPAAIPAAGAATCTSAGGVSVVVDFRELGGATVAACAEDGAGRSAAAVLASVGVGLSYAARQPGFVCRVNGAPASDPCVNTSPASAYWGLWWSDGAQGSWTYASSGVGGLTVPAGGSVGLSWQQGRETSGAVPPGVAPPVAPPAPTPSPTAFPTSGTSAPSPSSPTPTASPTRGNGSGASPSATPSSSPTASPSGTTSTSPTASPTASPSASGSSTDDPSVDDESRRDSRAAERSGKGSGKTSGRASDEAGREEERDSTPAPDDPALGRESPGDSPASDATGAGDAEAAGEPTRVPAAVTWGVLALLGAGIATSAAVARRRRASDPS